MSDKKVRRPQFPCGLPAIGTGEDQVKQATEIFYKLIDLIESDKRRAQFGSLIAYLTRLGYFTAPASHRYHLPFKGGLLVHHVNVALVLLHTKATLYPGISDESCVIVALLHDVGKLGTADRPYYALKPNEETMWTKREDPHPEAPVYMGVAVRSLAIVASKIDLSTWESQAIVYHDGQYIDDNHNARLKETPLTLLLHHADMWSAFQVEQKYPIADEAFSTPGKWGPK